MTAAPPVAAPAPSIEVLSEVRERLSAILRTAPATATTIATTSGGATTAGDGVAIGGSAEPPADESGAGASGARDQHSGACAAVGSGLKFLASSSRSVLTQQYTVVLSLSLSLSIA